MMKLKKRGIHAVFARGKQGKETAIIALAGNPNTGKSTVFNGLTGLNQHTGNWPGKTVVIAKGNFTYKNKQFTLVDLPGTYSLLANSADEQVARNFICFGNPDATVVVVDATCLERNLNLVLQVMEITPKVILCVNLVDEAKRKKLEINFAKLAELLGIPVVPTAARDKVGLEALKEEIYQMVFAAKLPQPRPVKYHERIEKAVARIQKKIDPYIRGGLNSRWVALRLLDGDQSILTEIENYLQSMSGQNTEAYPHSLKVVKCCD